jgi:undecaprenyl diphosphate synthase
VGIIMDGNGRWATSQGLPRSLGHREGARALRRVVEAAPQHGISVLTVYAFSADNWQRPADEVAWLMRLFRTYLRSEREACVQNGLRVSFIGRRDRVPKSLRREMETTERVTARCDRLHLRVALDYSARDAILRAARHPAAALAEDREAFERILALVDHGTPVPPVDLLIRTGDEQRLSDFLLWECAYAELYFTSVMWPAFGPEDLAEAVGAFHRRERRFGKVPARAGAA